MKKNTAHSSGFTLIELMVSITIMIILSGLSIAAYFRFSQRQASMNDARNFATEMRKVQALAKNLVYPTGCINLVGYRLVSDCSMSEDCKKMSYAASCGNGEFTIVTHEPVLETAFFTYNVSILFAAGTGNINPGAVGDYSLTNSSDPYQIVVRTDLNGNIDVKEL